MQRSKWAAAVGGRFPPAVPQLHQTGQSLRLLLRRTRCFRAGAGPGTCSFLAGELLNAAANRSRPLVV
ncbi:hypothetical protein [Salibacterium aidingense]|uniref:hypothetical protein n=1 Tax=Salibacterium aidingense TaxID=384933 RepID=UPI00042A79B7|nr:hypothetical protein [Salibacterium aidingense]